MSEQPNPPLVWAREQRAPRRQAPGVDRIVAAAVAIADAEGLDALSMRRVATDLGTGTTSLYRYVAGRDDLLDLMVDAVRSERPPHPLDGDWRTDLAAVARHLREDLLRHRWLGGIMMSRPSLGPNSLRQMDHALAAAAALTPDATLGNSAIRTLYHYVLGAVSDELTEQDTRRRTGLTEQQWQASVGPYLREIVASGEYPHFARVVIEAEHPDTGQRFEFGLDCLLAGLGTLAARAAEG
ncbi:TetR/AcrR family transcriptional regulator [Kitasatospora sp. NPDC006697]|uniref:TetR/AcrR family transcriptional regulator n=1 Tax=Kitasatospora sp. NPDC006697 TaxID=3364020 RepID=UPI0036CD38BA